MNKSKISGFLYGSLIRSLRRQFTFAFLVLTLLMMLYGVKVINTLQQTIKTTRELSESRLIHLQMAQDLVWETVTAARLTDKFQATTSTEETYLNYEELLKSLNKIDQLVNNLNIDDNTLNVLDLQYAKQLFINTANTLVQQRQMLAKDDLAFNSAYRVAINTMEGKTKVAPSVKTLFQAI